MARGLIGLLILLPTLLLNVARAQEPTVVRLALVAGSNDGGTSRVRLRHAVSDAHAVARVLTTLGGVDAAHLLVVDEPDRARLLAGLEDLKTRLGQARGGRLRVEALVYYSGHADETGLLPGGQPVPYAELRQRLQGLPADVRIAILDSCASGGLLRAKGGVRRAPFLLDAGAQVSGHAYLTSSSASEAAQESDALGGSYFTANLVAGLRGAADVSGDRRVTLSEAYQYAFHRTLARTEQTRRGPQHPAYDFELAGSGDVVITDLAGTGAILVLAPALQGRVLVRDPAGRLAAEVDKTAGRSLELGLDPGAYQVTLLQPKRALRGTAVLVHGQRTTVEPTNLAEVALDPTRARGDDPDPDVAFAAVEPDPSQRIAVTLGVLPGVATGIALGDTDATVERLTLSLLGGMHRSVHGISASILANLVRGDHEGAQLTAGLNLVLGQVRGVQMGAVNVAGRLRGVQLGLLNLSAHGDGEALGLLTLARDGKHHCEAWSSDTVALSLGCKLGTPHVYNLLLVEPGLTRPVRLGYGAGLHVDLARPYLDLDVAVLHDARDLVTSPGTWLGQLRMAVGMPVRGRLAVFAGVSVHGPIATWAWSPGAFAGLRL